MARVAEAISRRGDVMPRARSWTMPTDSDPAPRAESTGATPARTPASTTTTVTPTAATITAPSLTLMDGSPSSGREVGIFMLCSSSYCSLRGNSERVLQERFVSGGVADPVHRADDLGAELAPQRLDVGVDGPGAEPVPV